MHVHQVLVSASPGDAVTDATLALRPALRSLGDSEVFARYYAPSLAGDVLALAEYEWRAPAAAATRDDLLLVHASIGEPEVAAFLASRPERLVLVYHNISPAAPFAPYDPAFAALLDGGRREVAALRPRVALALADSAYNAGDLQSLGYDDVRVSPLAVDAGALTAVEPDPGTAHHLTTEVEGPVLLFVGQLLPHKRPDLLVRAFHVLATYLDPDAHLVLVGPARLPRYRAAVQHLVHELSLPGAWIAGPVSREALVAFYRRADAFVTASEHEGFCVPVLEAMAFDVPVVARGCAAVPETVGDAGLVLGPEEDPVLLGEAMAAVVADADLRAGLVARGRRRVEHFSPERSAATLLGHLAEIA
ncbi:MAG: glycosyltransferase [Actinomycetota bacterium]|nr:glycosyltransferase [Actinomycetota bacterium]